MIGHEGNLKYILKLIDLSCINAMVIIDFIFIVLTTKSETVNFNLVYLKHPQNIKQINQYENANLHFY